MIWSNKTKRSLLRRSGYAGQAGQAMLIAVLALGGAVLSATTIAGFLIAYQIRESTDFADSAKAIFAADSGIEWAQYSAFVNSSTPPIVMGNGATDAVTCYDDTQTAVTCGDQSESYAISEGSALNSTRAFELTFAASATSTGP